jgi:hypothetical protein
MKKTLTLCVFVCFSILSGAQAVLNEVYPQPGNGYHDFFELYNENNSSESLDNYTLVTYYEEGTKSGFYVLDFPNHAVAAHGYYVGASQNPFDIQSQLGQTADLNWNVMPAGGSLTKWERNGSSYTSVAVPANLNDLMVRIVGGSDGVYHIFVYKNGILVNGVVGGINTTTLPGTIKAMPNLPIDMTGSAPDFTIDFNAIADNEIEFIPNSLGTNNGYFRSSDGLCGEWLKSDAPGQHTPGSTNGLASNLNPGNQVTIAAVVSQYAMDPTKALLTYNITAGPAGAFPCTVEVYVDNGVAGQFDLSDVLLDSRVITSTTAGDQFVILSSWDVSVIIVVTPPTDCYNRTIAVGNYWSVLPIQLISFQGNINGNNRTTLQWSVGNNEEVDQFEIQRSFDGVEFKTIGLVFGSEKRNVEDYMFYETIKNDDKVMYRLKMISKTNEVSYSKVLVFQGKIVSTSGIRIIGNPVNGQLTFNYTAAQTRSVNIRIYDMNGRLMMTNKASSNEGNNIISFPLTTGFAPTMYVLEVNNGTEIQKAKFIKQ